jgi:putative FmdB family regulatory protein
MPTYEYRCPNGHEFDHFFRKISESQSSLPCPVCGLVAERIMSAGAGLVFKGSGFYITDYGKDGKKDQRPPKTAAASGESTTTDGAKPGSTGGGGEAASGDAGSKGEPKPAPAPPPATANAATEPASKPKKSDAGKQE